MEACLERFEVLSYFDFILSCESMATNKREPKIYLEVSDKQWKQICDIADEVIKFN